MVWLELEPIEAYLVRQLELFATTLRALRGDIQAESLNLA